MTSLVLGDLRFEVRRSAVRRTLELTLERDGRLVIAAPERCEAERIERFVLRRREWIYRKLAEREALPPPLPRKEYVSGEGFAYLGRSYRLLLVLRQEVPVKLEEGRFKLRRADAAQGREHMIRWYAAHGQPWLAGRVERYANRLGVVPGKVTVRELGYRWGSCGKGGRLYFHWKSVMLPPRIIEYVVVHELVHLAEPNHRPEFWRRIARAMPDYVERKAWLDQEGARLGEL